MITNFADTMADQMREAIKKAYTAGFQYAMSLKLDDNDFVDLGLPSGTMWSKEFLGVTDATSEGEYYSFNEAQKYSLPTVEQVEELKKCCTVVRDGHSSRIIGPNGNEFLIKANKIYDRTKNRIQDHYPHQSIAAYTFWLQCDKIDSKKCITTFKIEPKFDKILFCEDAAPMLENLQHLKTVNHFSTLLSTKLINTICQRRKM